MRVRGGALAAVVAAALAFAGGCAGDDGDAAEPVTTTTAETDRDDAATTTTDAASTTATTTFAQADTPPPLVNTGEDFDAIVRSFVAYGEWLSVHPDPARAADIYREGGPAWERFHTALEDFAAQGLRTDGATPGRVTEARLLERPSADLAIVYVVIDNPDYAVLDREGRLVREVEGDPLRAVAYELRRQEPGRWLIEDRTELGEVE